MSLPLILHSQFSVSRLPLPKVITAPFRGRLRYGRSAFPIQPQDVARFETDQQPFPQRVANHADELLV